MLMASATDTTNPNSTDLTLADLTAGQRKFAKPCGDDTVPECGAEDTSMKQRSVILSIIYLMFGLANNVGVVMMGKRMKPYSDFLLYGTTMLYTLCFAIIALVLKETWRLDWKHHKNFLWLGFFTSVNGVLSQLSVPFVTGELTTVLVTLSIPVTWISAWYMFRYEVTVYRILCFVAILGSILLGLVPSMYWGAGDTDDTAQNKPFWVILTICSAIPTAFETTYQEKAFKILDSPKFVTLTIYNFYSLATYVAAIPLIKLNAFRPANADHGLTTSEMWENQALAFRCYFAHDYETFTNSSHAVHASGVPGCEHGAVIWVTLFTLGYVGFFGVGTYLLKYENSSLVANLNALLVPLSVTMFWIKPLCGDASEDPVWWVGVSAALVALFVVLNELPHFKWYQNSATGVYIQGSWLDRVLVREHWKAGCGTDHDGAGTGLLEERLLE